MNWVQARNLLRLAARRRSELRPLAPPEDDALRPAREDATPARESSPPVAVRAASICVVSGKGGTGKSVVSASLAALFSQRGRTLIVDADMGVGNAHLMQGISPKQSFVDVVEGNLPVRAVVESCGAQLDLVAAGSGVSRMADLNSFELHLIAAGLEELEREYRYLLVDSAAGISEQTLAFAAASDLVLIVTTPDITAMTDAYAFLKVLLARRPEAQALLVVNRARDFTQAEETAQRIREVSQRFLGAAPRWLGFVPQDDVVEVSVAHRRPVALEDPASSAARSLRTLAVRTLEATSRAHPRGLGNELLRRVGYPARLA